MYTLHNSEFNVEQMQNTSDYLRTPHKLLATRGVVNVSNLDNKSFMWSILASLYRNKHNRTSSLQQFVDKINMSGIEFPVSVKSIDLFEQLNPDISVSVLGYDDELYPVRITTQMCIRDRHLPY